MNLPKIDPALLPDLTQLTGMFGSMRTPGHDDTIIMLATIVWDSGPPGGGLI